MVAQALVKEFMQSNPTKIWTAPEIASFLFKDQPASHYPRYRSEVFAALQKLERWGDVVRMDMVDTGSKQLTRGWVLA